MIDVVFFLLIFFMLATTFTKEAHLSISLPEADGQSGEANAQQIEIIINSIGSYIVNGKSLVNNRLETLMSAIREVSGGVNTIPLIITADANTPHQFVVTAMDASGQLGFTHLSISTTKKEQE
jgi:biopolymer transport protein ExbD